jgi:hypothetical protein
MLLEIALARVKGISRREAESEQGKMKGTKLEPWPRPLELLVTQRLTQTGELALSGGPADHLGFFSNSTHGRRRLHVF